MSNCDDSLLGSLMVSGRPRQLILNSFSSQKIDMPALDLDSLRIAVNAAARHSGLNIFASGKNPRFSCFDAVLYIKRNQHLKEPKKSCVIWCDNSIPSLGILSSIPNIRREPWILILSWLFTLDLASTQ